jgi:membrane-bound metal-dependent hydrolase YbcI (DUF457 family)
MASFKAHISFGFVTAVALSVATVTWALAPVEIVPLVFILTMIGSMLPDIDSDTGKPVEILFAILAVICTLFTFSYLNTGSQINKELIFISLGSGLFFYFIVRYFFKKLTHHRGIFHSIPMAFIMGLLTILALKNYNFTDESLRVIGLSVVAGYLCHLILDELNSAVNLSGIPFIPKKSLGSALKLTTKSTLPTVIMYFVLIFLLFINQKILLISL